MSLSQIMSSATSGLMVAQTGLRAVSDNIANVNTQGYVRKLVQQTPLLSAGFGVGVDVSRVLLASDRFLQSAALNATSTASQAGAVASGLDQAQALFGDPTADSSFFSRLDSLYAAFSTAGANAASSVGRSAALDSVTGFLDEASRISASLGALRSEADSRIAADVDSANALLTQINDLNAEITRSRVSTGDSTGAENIQLGLINQLSQLMDVNISQRSGGGVVIRASDGAPLAGEGGAATLSYVRGQGVSGAIMVTQPGSAGQSALPVRLTGGEIRGLMDLRDSELPAVSEQLSEFVSSTVDELNRAHNAASAVPPPTTLTGRDTGLDLTTAVSGFTGKTSLAVVGPDGTLQKQIAIDFTAGTMTVDGGTATSFTPASFLTSLNSALGTSGSASFTNGALSLSANGGAGLAIADDAADPSAKAGKGFSHFFGLNDLVASSGVADYDTGLRASDPHGFTAGDTVTFRVSGADGARLRDITVTVPAAGSMQDLLSTMNAPGSGLGLYGQFSLDANGAMTFAPNNAGSASLSVVADNTQRGAGGPSITELFGIGSAERGSRASQFSVRTDIAADPSRLALATLDLSQAATGNPVLSAADGRGGALLAASGERSTGFSAAGGLAASSMTVSRYAAEFAGSIGRRAEAAASRQETAQAVASEAVSRRTSVEGVNLDEELISMTTYQQAFNASARVIQASKDMYDVLLGILGA